MGGCVCGISCGALTHAAATCRLVRRSHDCSFMQLAACFGVVYWVQEAILAHWRESGTTMATEGVWEVPSLPLLDVPKMVCLSLAWSIMYHADHFESLLGLAFESAADEQRYVYHQTMYARNEVEAIGNVLVGALQLYDVYVSYRPSVLWIVLNLVHRAGRVVRTTRLLLALVRLDTSTLSKYTSTTLISPTFEACVRTPGKSTVYVEGLCLRAKPLNFVRAVYLFWFPLYWSLTSTETYLSDKVLVHLDVVSTPVVLLLVPGMQYVDVVAYRLVMLSTWGAYHYKDAVFLLSCVGTLILLYLCKRIERECWLSESKLNGRLSTALAFLSHETRNQIVPSLAIVEGERFQNESDKDAVIAALSTVDGILSNVLTMAKVSSEAAPFPARAFAVRQWVEAASSAGHRCVNPGVKFKLTCDAPVPLLAEDIARASQGESDHRSDGGGEGQVLWATGSMAALTQVVTNALSNACKFTHEGTVTLSWEVRPQGPAMLSFVVKCTDTGSGIPADEMPGLLDDFGRVRKSTKPGEGTGLGLPLAKRMMERMGGTFELTSAPGVGTEVAMSIVLPRARGPADGTAAALAGLVCCIHPPAIGSVRADCLCVDDSKLCRMVYERTLKKAGFSVRLAESGHAALASIKAGARYELIFMDMDMPELDGCRTTLQIRRLSYSGAIMLVTGNNFSAQERVDMCHKYGLDHIFTKGASPDWRDLVAAWRRDREARGADHRGAERNDAA